MPALNITTRSATRLHFDENDIWNTDLFKMEFRLLGGRTCLAAIYRADAEPGISQFAESQNLGDERMLAVPDATDSGGA